ncbi:uncharacterized protein LOC133178398 [Saccostrea echinata]|uniref:uncharacterized protein LOC133178398 n=1 Tax=Saccostrea echinata TaxID=191078 RepID=UPI002A810D90|nr:uncharacterized protein LOC133178398 [Saccostrea echinata]
MMSVLTKDDLESMKTNIEIIKALPNPPQAVKDTLEAVALLLGYPPRQAKNWAFLQQLCKTGRFQRHMQEFQCEDVNLNSVKKARRLLSTYDRNTISGKCHAVVGLFIWAESAVLEVENYLETRKELMKERKISQNGKNKI